MSNYPFSQFDAAQSDQPQGASAQVFTITPSTSKAAAGKSARTEGQATLSDFSVAPQNRSQAIAFSSLLELNQGRSVQMIKMGN